MSVIRSVTNGGTSTVPYGAATSPFPVNPVNGDNILVFVSAFGRPNFYAVSVADNYGNTYSLLGRSQLAEGISVFIAINIVGGSSFVVTPTMNNNGAGPLPGYSGTVAYCLSGMGAYHGDIVFNHQTAAVPSSGATSVAPVFEATWNATARWFYACALSFDGGLRVGALMDTTNTEDPPDILEGTGWTALSGARQNNNTTAQNCLTETQDSPTSLPIPLPATAAPVTPCEPQSLVSGGGTGASGCNGGGNGWVSDYPDGPFGTVPQHPDPTNGEALFGKYAVDLWIALHHKDYPSAVITTYRRSMVELADLNTYHGGRKPAGVLSIGDIEHGLGTEKAKFEAGNIDISISDATVRWIRGLLSDQELDGDEIEVYLASPPARRAGSDPRVLMRAVIQGTDLSASLKASLHAVDILFSIFGPFGARPRWPFYKFSDVFASDSGCPADVLSRTIPVLYGEKSDKGATDPVTNVPISKGLCPLHYVGKFTGITGATTATTVIINSLPLDSTIPVIPSAAAIDISGGTVLGGLDTKVVAVIAGKEAPISNPAGTGSFSDPTYGPRAVGVFFNGVTGAEAYRAYFGNGSYGPHGAVSATIVRVKQVNVADLASGDWAGAAFRQYSITLNGWDDGTDALGTQSTAAADEWALMVATLGPCFRFIQVFGSDLGAGDPNKKHDRVLLDPTTRGDLLVPGVNFTQAYVPFTNTQGKVFWLHGVWVKGDSQLLADHLAGTVNMTANLIGREHVGNGTGLPFMHAMTILNAWIENDLIGDWTSGPLATDLVYPQWPDGTAKVRSLRFTARQNYTINALGGIGLSAGWYVHSDRSVPDWFNHWNVSTEATIGGNGFGQVSIGYIDELADTTTWPRLDHPIHFFGKTPVKSSFGENRGVRENTFVASCDYDPDKDKFRIGPITKFSQAGIDRLKGQKKPGDPIESTILNRQNQLEWIVNKRMSRVQFGTKPVDIDGKIWLLDYDVDDDKGFLVNSIEGRGASGFVNTPMQRLRRRLAISSRMVTYSLVDVTDIMVQTSQPGGLAQVAYANNNSITDTPFYATNDTSIAPLARN